MFVLVVVPVDNGVPDVVVFLTRYTLSLAGDPVLFCALFKPALILFCICALLISILNLWKYHGHSGGSNLVVTSA